jgi:hypothetical protein
MDVMDVDTVSLAKATDLHPEPPRKKIKASELPLSSATRNAIETLSHTFKKKGGYDALRKQVWEKLEASVSVETPGNSAELIINSRPRISKRN